jgi:Uma2 family endonuclease
MIAARQEFLQLNPAEYLDWEEQQEFRHEFVDGEVYAMTGGTINHSKIAVNLTILLGNHLRGSGCQVLNSDAKVEIVESNCFFYPDVSVTCDERDRNASKFISNPCLIIEVLSPSTEAYDRGDKFRLYRQSASLQEYILVSTTGIAIDVYQRNESGRWEIISYSSGDTLELKSLNFSFEIDRVYDDITFN